MKDEGAPTDLKIRTRAFGVRVMRLADSLPRGRSADVVANQVIRSGLSVGAHYREGVRSRSNAEFIIKLEGGLQELEETSYWFEVLVERGLVSATRLAPLRSECDELPAIFVAGTKKLKAKPRH